jgi:hypothetical protein
MRPSTRIVLLLIAAVLLRGMPSAYAFAAGHGHMTEAPVATAGDDCPDHAPQAQSAPDSRHGGASCQIACDLGVAPALSPLAACDSAPPSVASAAVLHPLRLTDAPPPDHPPPIR